MESLNGRKRGKIKRRGWIKVALQLGRKDETEDDYSDGLLEVLLG
jgi:hypothetical protein